MPVVLDSSAVVAWIRQERGWEVVDRVLDQSTLAAVNLVEIIEVLARYGLQFDPAKFPAMLVEAFDYEQGVAAGALLREHRPAGFSLGDACCVALAMKLEAEVITADQLWSRIRLPVPITIIR